MGIAENGLQLVTKPRSKPGVMRGGYEAKNTLMPFSSTLWGSTSPANHPRLHLAVFGRVQLQKQVQFLVCKVKPSCSAPHPSLCICPSGHEMLKLPITLTRGCIFKEQSYKSGFEVKAMYKNSVQRGFFFSRYSQKFSFSLWWMLRLPGRAGRATRKSWGIMYCRLLHF